MTGRWSPPLQMRVGVDDALEPPPPLDRRLEERRRVNPPPAPPKDDLSVDLATLSTWPRPRDRMWTAASTCKGCGEHGWGIEEEGIEILDGVVDVLDDSAVLAADALDDEAVDRDVEEWLQEDPPPRRRQSQPA